MDQKKHSSPFFIIVGVIAIVAALVIGYRSLGRLYHSPLPRPRQTDISMIKGWMTLPLLAHTYHIPEHVLYERLKIEDREQLSSLDIIAKNHNESPSEFLERVKGTITLIQEERRPSNP